MTNEEIIVFAIEICNEADMIKFSKSPLFIQWSFIRLNKIFSVGTFIDDKFEKEKFKSQLTTLLLHSYYYWN